MHAKTTSNRHKEIFKNPAAVNFLRANRLGVLATSSHEDNSPQTAFVYYVLNKELDIFILTSKESRKFKNITKNSKVSFLVGQEIDPVVLQIEGMASVVVDTDLKFEVTKLLATAANANPKSLSFPPQFYIAGKNKIIQITVTDLKYSNFTHSQTVTRSARTCSGVLLPEVRPPGKAP